MPIVSEGASRMKALPVNRGRCWALIENTLPAGIL